MSERPTTADLLAEQQISEDDIVALVAASVSDHRPGPLDLALGYRMDVADAIDSGTLMREILGRAGASDMLKRSAVRAALMQALPVKA